MTKTIIENIDIFSKGDINIFLPKVKKNKKQFIREVKVFNQEFDDCIFCRNDKNRILLETANFILLAGAGPIINGYCIIYPKKHLPSFSKLPQSIFSEFLILRKLLLEAFKKGHGATGHTAYEHGGIGSCLTLESQKVKTSHCFHAHMIFFPHAVDITDQIIPYFNTIKTLEKIENLLLIEGHYIYYEFLFDHLVKPIKYVFSDAIKIYSQFMRKNLCNSLNLPDRWNWFENPNWNLVYETKLVLEETLRDILLINKRSILEQYNEIK